MIGLENLGPELATDLIKLVNSLQKLNKSCKVEYSVQNKKTNEWMRKSFSYVPLDDILEKIKENNNFAFMQPIGFDTDSQCVGIKCILIHKSGKFIESPVFPIKTFEGMKIQDEGAEITYRKRYAAGAFFGLATEEDTNGNDDEATEKKEIKATEKQIALLSKYYQGDNLKKLLEMCKIEKIEDISIKKASELISTCKKREGELKNGTSKN